MLISVTVAIFTAWQSIILYEQFVVMNHQTAVMNAQTLAMNEQNQLARQTYESAERSLITVLEMKPKKLAIENTLGSYSIQYDVDLQNVGKSVATNVVFAAKSITVHGIGSNVVMMDEGYNFHSPKTNQSFINDQALREARIWAYNTAAAADLQFQPILLPGKRETIPFDMTAAYNHWDPKRSEASLAVVGCVVYGFPGSQQRHISGFFAQVHRRRGKAVSLFQITKPETLTSEGLTFPTIYRFGE